MTPDERLTLRQIKDETGISTNTLRVDIWRKRLPATREDSGRGPLWYVTRADLDAYLASRTTRTKETST